MQDNPVFSYYHKLISRRRMWESVWQDIAAFEMPRRLINLGLGSEGEDQMYDIFDSTAVFSVEVLAASLQSGLTNSALKWFTLKFPDANLGSDPEGKEYLDEVNLRMLQAFGSSNWGTETSEVYLDLGAFGIGACFMGEADAAKPVVAGNSFRGFHFMAQPIGSYVIDENAFGMVDTIIYKVPMSAAAAAQRFGIANLHPDSQKMAKENPSADLCMIHFVAPKKRWPDTKTNMAFASQWYEEKQKHLVSEGGFQEFPFLVPRWAKTSGEMYGRGPGFTALPDVKTLNKTIELNLKALAIAAQPPVKAKLNSVIGSIDFESGGVTYVRNMDDLDEFVTTANFQATEVKIQDMRESIRRVFNVDFLLQILARETPMMTATEVSAKMQLLREINGPVFGRLETELLSPAVDRGFAIMDRAGALPPPPPHLEDRQIQVDYESPIGLAKRGQELTAIDRVMLRAQEIAAAGRTDVLDNLDVDVILQLTGEISGAPQKIFVSKEIRDEARQARQEQATNDKQLMDLAGASEIGKNIAPLAKVIQGAEGGGA